MRLGQHFRAAASSRILKKCLGDRFRALFDSGKTFPSPATDPLDPTENL